LPFTSEEVSKPLSHGRIRQSENVHVRPPTRRPSWIRPLTHIAASMERSFQRDSEVCLTRS
jgi:hypothetical protein